MKKLNVKISSLDKENKSKFKPLSTNEIKKVKGGSVISVEGIMA